MEKGTVKLPNGKIQKVLFIIAILFVFIAIYLLNRLYPLLADDWDYSFIWTFGEYSPHRVSGIIDIVNSQYSHYMLWGGRSITHGIVQFLLMLGTDWSDLINSLVFVLFMCLIYTIVNKKNEMNISVFLLLVLGLWFCLPSLMTTVVWLTYSVNYLGGTLIILLFIYPYYNYYRTGVVSDGFLKIVLMFVAGIIAGWTNENMSIATIFFLGSLLILLRYQKKTIPRWAIWGFIGAIIGCIVLLIAPGNYLRLESTVIGYSKRIDLMAQHYLHYMLLLSGIYIALFIFFIRKSVLKNKSNIVLSSLLFFISAHVGFAAMIGSPEFPPRVLFGVVTFMIIGIGILYSNINIEYPKFTIINLLLVIVLFVFFCIDYVDKYRYTSYLNNFWNERELFVNEQKQKGVTDIIFTDEIVYNDDFIVLELRTDSNIWINKVYARYYGVHSVKRVTK